MSKLTEAMEMLQPVTDPDRWDGNTWMGAGDVPQIAGEAIRAMQEVDAMMEQIAAATSRPVDAEDQVRSALEMAAAGMADMPLASWPQWIAHLLQMLEMRTSEENYRAVLQAIQNAIVTRLGATAP